VPSLKNLRITTKFILFFLLASSIPLITAIAITYNISRNIIKKELANTLSLVADNRARQIESYLWRQKHDGISLFSAPSVVETVESLSNAFNNIHSDRGSYDDKLEKAMSIFSYYKNQFGYEDIFIFNPDGYPIFFTNRDIKYELSAYEINLSQHTELAEVFRKAKDSGNAETSGFDFAPRSKKGQSYIAIPLSKPEGLIAVAIIELSSQGLYNFVQDYTGLGNTGELMLASKIRGEDFFITPLRFDPEMTFLRKVKDFSRETQSIDIQQALEGKSGFGIVEDYRGNRVFSFWRYLPSIKLGMAVKMDTQEVFASADKLRDNLLKLSLLFLTAVIFVAFYLAKTISRPIKNLTATSKIIAGGELGVRVSVESDDEIGEMARSFNKMTDSLVEEKALLEKANKELDSFVYTVSHDLRTPLYGIQGMAKIFQREFYENVNNQGKELFERIMSATERMKTLIDDLLKLSRISRIKNPYEDTDIGQIIKSIQARLDFEIKKKNVELAVCDNMPVVHCDRIKIEEAFYNLINNAIKFSSKNNPTPKVQIGYAKRDQVHEFYVKDNGIGIDKKNHSEIFGIFKRLHSSSEYEGSGAGLAIVKKIVEDHGGSIWVDSEPGKGATFYFTVPADLKEKASAEKS
jgi:signal transduction histidine kinase